MVDPSTLNALKAINNTEIAQVFTVLKSYIGFLCGLHFLISLWYLKQFIQTKTMNTAQGIHYFLGVFVFTIPILLNYHDTKTLIFCGCVMSGYMAMAVVGMVSNFLKNQEKIEKFLETVRI